MNPTKMSIKGRIVHMFTSEIIAILIITSLSKFIYKNIIKIGLLAIILSVLAMLWTFIYNWIFDIIEKNKGGIRFQRKLWLRVIHAIFFEITLFLITTPIIMIILKKSFLLAIKINCIFIIFYVSYGIIFNYIYDYIYVLINQSKNIKKKRV